MTRVIIAGLDGSPASLAAADWAAREAVRRAVPLRLLHAWNVQHGAHAYGPHPGGETHRHWTLRIPREAEADLKRRYPGLEVSADQVDVPPVTALLDAAADADLLVLGTRAVNAASGYLMGSVALAVTARTDRPVVLVRSAATAQADRLPDADGRPSLTAAYRDVVLGLDLARPDDHVIGFAFQAAHDRAATLRVVHGRNLPAAYGFDVAGFDVDLGTELAVQEADAFDSVVRPWREKFPDVRVTSDPVVGNAARHLTEAAAGACLVVIGRRTRGGAPGPRLGSVAHALLHHSPAPVAVVPHD